MTIDWNLLLSTWIPQILLLILVWGAIAWLAVSGRPIPDALLDAGFAVLGFYFHSLVTTIGANTGSN